MCQREHSFPDYNRALKELTDSNPEWFLDIFLSGMWVIAYFGVSWMNFPLIPHQFLRTFSFYGDIGFIPFNPYQFCQTEYFTYFKCILNILKERKEKGEKRNTYWLYSRVSNVIFLFYTSREINKVKTVRRSIRWMSHTSLWHLHYIFNKDSYTRLGRKLLKSYIHRNRIRPPMALYCIDALRTITIYAFFKLYFNGENSLLLLGMKNSLLFISSKFILINISDFIIFFFIHISTFILYRHIHNICID